MKLHTFKIRTNVASRSIHGLGPQVWNSMSKSLNILKAHQTLINVTDFSARFRRVTTREYSNELILNVCGWGWLWDGVEDGCDVSFHGPE